MMKNAGVYYCNDYGFDCKKYENLLPKDRLKKYNRLKPIRAKQNCMGAYLLARYALKEYGITEFKLVYSEKGKPYVDGGKIFFNLSHTENGYVCAVDTSEIGVDIESLRDFKESMINRAFSPQEKEAALKSENPQKSFTTLWTLKESSIKRNGETVSQYSKYSFVCPPEDFYAGGYHYKTFDCGESIVSVCGTFEKTELKKVIFSDLV